MTRGARIAAALALGAVALLVGSPKPAAACAPALPPGAEVHIADEHAVIIWDAKAKREHFIRAASFTSTTPSFGFLVPTPSLPELGEIPREVVWDIGEQIARKVETREGPTKVKLSSFLLGFLGGEAKSGADSAEASVVVVGTANVAGMDASILKATDAGALAAWLGDHGLERTQALDEWLVPYVKKGWYVTAFVIAATSPKSSSRLSTQLVRMSFDAEQPFYPYREPAPASGATPVADRELQVDFLSSERMGATTNGAPWSAETKYAGRITVPAGLRAFAGENTYDTTFLDRSSPRVATDEITFGPSADAGDLVPPPIIVMDPKIVRIPIEALFALGLVVSGVIALLLRKKRSPRAAKAA